jgi:hypothetical protein
VRFSEFLGIAYFGDQNQHVITPIFDVRHNAELGWKKVMIMHTEKDKRQGQHQEQIEEEQQQHPPLFHTVFVEHPTRYEFIAYPLKMRDDQMNYAIYRSFSSLTSLHSFKSNYKGKAFIKFGWYDITKKQKFDVLSEYAVVDAVEFKNIDQLEQGALVDRIRKS